MKKIFITGITGMVGSHLCDYLLANHPHVEIHGLLRWRSPKDNIIHIMNDIHLHYGDLLDLSFLLKTLEEVRPDYITHAAAQSLVPYSFDNPVTTLQTNVIGTCNLLEAIKILKLKDGYDPVINIISSSEVYGQVKKEELPIKENQPLRPSSPYAVSKVGEDMLGYQYWLSYEIRTIRTRAFSHLGSRRADSFVVSNFAKQLAKIEAGLQEPIVHVGNLGSVRTFADVRDTVRAYWMLLEKCEPGEVYNIGGNTTLTVGRMLDKLIIISGIPDIRVQVDKKRLRPSDVTLQIPCIDKFKKATGWEPEIPFEKTLLDMLNFWRNWIGRNF